MSDQNGREMAAAQSATHDAPVTLTLSPAEARLVRMALDLLSNDSTHRDQLHPAIRAILARLPAPS